MPYKDKTKQTEASRRYRERHRNNPEWRESRAEQQKAWRQNNPDRYKELQKENRQKNQWYKKNPDKIKAAQEKYRLSHLEKMAEKSRKFRRNNPEKVKQYTAKRNSNNDYRERERQRAREWARTHTKENRKRLVEWKENNPDKWSISNRRHSAKRKRELGFMPLNNYFDDSEAHHIDINNVIFIPEDLHKAYPHRQDNNESMKRINIIAFDYMSSACL